MRFKRERGRAICFLSIFHQGFFFGHFLKMFRERLQTYFSQIEMHMALRVMVLEEGLEIWVCLSLLSSSLHEEG